MLSCLIAHTMVSHTLWLWRRREHRADHLASPGNSTCLAALSAACATKHARGVTQCVGCVQAHDADLTAAGCGTVLKEGYCGDAGKSPGPPPPVPGGGSKPDDCPCITWQKGGCHSALNGPLSNYPENIYIYSAWQWHSIGSDNGACSVCDGQPGQMSCAYIFPCLNADVNVWGHHDVLLWGQGEPCNAQGLNGTDSQSCNQWWPGKGPKADMFGWQLTQQGAMPDQSQGKLIVYNGLYLARSVQASPYANCGTGNVGWVQLQADGSLGCMECASISIHPSTTHICRVLGFSTA
jgi:hypothetical protein